MSLQRPAWLKEHLKKQVPDQITILNKSMYEPISTGNGMDGKPQVAMPVDRMLHERETVLNAATTDALGGQKGVKNLVMGALSEKGINRMPMPKESSIRQAASNNAAMAGNIMGMPNMRNSAGYIEGTLTQAPEVRTATIATPATMPTPNLSGLPAAPMPEVKTTIAEPAVNPKTPNANKTPQQLWDEQEAARKAMLAGKAAALTPQTTTTQAAVMPEFKITSQSMTPAEEEAQALSYGFKSAEDTRKAATMGLNATDYYAELAARNAPATTSTGAQMPDARGMSTFRQQYDYAAQQADARSAASDMALGMRMAQNPNLTQGAQNTMLQEQMMAKGTQQSKLAGDAAQSAYGIQREQNQKAMDAMLAAGDVDGFAKMFQEEHGIPIDKTAMSSTLNQRALSTAANGLNTRIAQLGDRATLDDPLTKNYLEGIWAATGNTGTMDAQWANNFLQREVDSYDPVFQAMKFYPEKSARTLWGDEAIDSMVDPRTGTTGYKAFQHLYARGMATAFSSYDPATQDFKVANDSFLESLFNPTIPVTPVAPLENTADALTIAKNAGFNSVEEYNASLNKTVDYKSLTDGGTVDYGGKKWTVGQDVDGSKILLSSDGKTWARVDSTNKVIPYTGDNDTGLQTIGGKTYNNGTEVIAKVGGNNLPINKDGEGNFVMVGTQRVPVTVNEAGNVSIQGSYIDAGKLYVNGKEIKVNGASLKLPDTAIDDFANGRPVTATVGGKTYKVTNDGQAPTLYSAEDFLYNPTPDGLKAAIENGSADEVFTAYENKFKTKVDPVYINSLVEAGSPKAKDYAINAIISGKMKASDFSSPEIVDTFTPVLKRSTTTIGGNMVQQVAERVRREAAGELYVSVDNQQGGNASIEEAKKVAANFPIGKTIELDGKNVYIKNYGNKYVDPFGLNNYREHTLTYVDLATGKEVTRTWKVGDF